MGCTLPKRGARPIPKEQPSAGRRRRAFFEGTEELRAGAALRPTPKPSGAGLKTTTCRGCSPKGRSGLSLLTSLVLADLQTLTVPATLPLGDLPRVHKQREEPVWSCS